MKQKFHRIRIGKFYGTKVGWIDVDESHTFMNDIEIFCSPLPSLPFVCKVLKNNGELQ